ncbi:MAG TPA: hypothetical protein VGH19_14985 [Verrucomicrobiae bacterium]
MKTLLLSLALATSSVAAYACGGYGDFDHYTAHEWGTFTSIQGTDGVPIAWQSLVVGDLPRFVYNRTRAEDAKLLGNTAEFFGKGSMAARQRIETPVIYFYSLKPQTIDVRVDLPQGKITEWYPQISKFGPVPGEAVTPFIDPGQRDKSFIQWSKVQVIPRGNETFPSEKGGSHYYAARETDASPVQVTPPTVKEGKPTVQNEKFLFYRGVAGFPSPLMAKTVSDNSVTMQNQLNEPLKHLFVIDQRANEYAFSYHAELPAKQELTADISIVSSRTQTFRSRDQLIQAMKDSLTKSGLFEKESAAMVKTWEDSWFDESGVRILYVLPEKWVDATMPLKFTPEPAKIARVFVGRAELFTPSLEHKLTQLVKNYGAAEFDQKKVLIQSVKDLRLGRFTQAAFDRVIRLQNDKAFTTAAYELQGNALMPAPAHPPSEHTAHTKVLTAVSTSLIRSNFSPDLELLDLVLDCGALVPR